MSSNASTPWRNGCEGAVSLTFDDGRASQLVKAVPIMAEFGLRGTFYLNPRDDFDLAPWRELARLGHEIGNHTVTHPCSRALWDDPDSRCLETLTLEEVEADILEASRRIRTAIPEQAEFSFCYPCYNAHVGEGLTRRSYVPLVAQHFVAGRGRGEWGHNHPATCDLAYLYSWNVELMNGPLLVGLAQQAISKGRWVIFTIHGIEEGHLPLAEVAFRELCSFLRDRGSEIWTAPVVEVARQVKAWREAEATR